MANDPVGQVGALGALWSPNLEQYVRTGGAAGLICALCTDTPCRCPEFGTPEYLALFNARHDRK
jgi:hypothetical protein